MLETLFKPNTGASLSGCVRWTQPMDGVRVCDFDCALTVPPALSAEPSEVPCEVLFCWQGGLRLTMTDGRQVFLQEHEVLLLLGASVKSLSVADGLFGGELVLIEQSAAAPCRLTVNAARIKARVTPHLGCVVLRSAVWIDNLAAALQSVPERDRAAGCSPQARHKVNCLKGKRGSPGGYSCRAIRRYGDGGQHLRR